MRIAKNLAVVTVGLFVLACLSAIAPQTQVAHAQSPDVPQASPNPVTVAEANIPPMGVKQDEPVYTIPPVEREVMNVIREIHTKGDISWNNQLLNVPEAWKKTKGAGVNVAVLDTGVDSNHPDLKTRVVKEKNFTRSSTPVDKQGHGTHCAGIVAANGDLQGVAPEAKIFAGKVLDDGGSGGVSGIANGIDWATTEGADVISMSLGGPSSDTFIPPALKRADAAGVIVIAAAGNEGPGANTDGYPARYPECVSVAACDKNKAIANFSSRGKSVWITGPGVNVRSTYPGGQYATMSGTSMACPHLAGVAALWVAGNPGVAKKDRPAAFRNWLKAVGSVPVRTDTTGHGIPDAGKLNDGGPVTPPPVTPGPGYTLIIALTDLTAAKQAELKALGVDKFRLEIGTGLPSQPAPIPPTPVEPPRPTPVPVQPPNTCPPGGCLPGNSGRWEPFGGRFRIFR